MMINLTDMKIVRSILGRHGFHFSKKLGQNFLIDPSVCPRIAEEGNAAAGYGVLEIGPGIGTLTQQLALRAEKVTSVELDQRLLPILEETVGEFENLHILHGDILQFDVPQLLEQEFAGLHVAVCANLPYYITTPIIMGLFESNVPIDNITVMVQKEVADRMQVGPGSKDYGALSLAVQYYAEPYIVANVPPNCFIPRPNVGSAVIRLTRHKEMPVQVADPKLMFRLIRASFNQRRKTLQNGLNNAPDVSFTKEQIVAAIESLGVPATIRGEALDLRQFAQLANYFTENCK